MGLWLALRPTGQVMAPVLAAYPIVLGVIGGIVVRPRGRWGETLALGAVGAGGMLVLFLTVGIAALIAAPMLDPHACDNPADCDTGPAVGMAMAVFAACGLAFALLPGLAVGKLLGRLVSRRRHSV